MTVFVYSINRECPEQGRFRKHWKIVDHAVDISAAAHSDICTRRPASITGHAM